MTAPLADVDRLQERADRSMPRSGIIYTAKNDINNKY
jgi:hypothetical protein